ncbi:MAG: DUF2666 domain-containing protein [Candidatus Marsarchaeota archaeon]|nr:DUF2666 domain-containing protein [Candidatus Marsarchaeota archaeon]
MDEPKEYIDFVAKYKDWISIKKMTIRPETKTQEIAFHLIGIKNSFDKKIFDLLNVNTLILDEFVLKIIKDKKNYESLTKALLLLNSKEAKEAINKACNKKEAPIAEIYLLNKIITESGFNITVPPQLLSKLYPELKLKLPKGLGRSKGNIK